jgi:hypothetical protein
MLTSKVNPILYASLFPTLLNGILLHITYYDHARFISTPIRSREEALEARGLKSDIMEALKRRRKKKLPQLHQSLRPPRP